VSGVRSRGAKGGAAGELGVEEESGAPALLQRESVESISRWTMRAPGAVRARA
jgi:hypothetical protein